jgi:hypothetical protein
MKFRVLADADAVAEAGAATIAEAARSAVAARPLLGGAKWRPDAMADAARAARRWAPS